MGALYTSLPLDNPSRQFYQNVINNSRKQLVKQWAFEGKIYGGSRNSFYEVYDKSKTEAKDTEPLVAQVRDGKIVDTWSDRNNKNSNSGVAGYDRRAYQQQDLQELYEMMRGGFFGNNSWELF